MRRESASPRKWQGAATVLVFLASLLSISCGGGMVNASQTAGANDLSLNTSSVDFGNVSLGSSKNSVVTLTNSAAVGSLDVVFTKVTVTGSAFSVSPVALPITMAPGQMSAITVTFTPKASGTATGSLSIVVSGTTDPMTVPLTGSGVGSGQLAVAPASLNFGSLTVGSSKTLTGTLTPGTSTITVSSAAVNGAGYSISGLTFPLTVAAGTAVTYSVTFTPQSAGSVPGSISFLSNAANSPATQTFAGIGTQGGTGTSSTPGNLTVAPATLAFGSVAVGSSKNLKGTLTAAGSGVVVSSASWTGQGYAVSGVTFPLTIPAGSSVSYTVTVTPQATGSIPGGISFVSNAANAPTAETFTATGTQAPAQSATHTVNLSWAASTSAVVGYNVYRGTQSGGPYTQINPASVPTTSYADSTVQSGATYFYVVTSVDANSVESSFSNEVTAVIPTP